jgi:hypothetical protein
MGKPHDERITAGYAWVWKSTDGGHGRRGFTRTYEEAEERLERLDQEELERLEQQRIKEEGRKAHERRWQEILAVVTPLALEAVAKAARTLQERQPDVELQDIWDAIIELDPEGG